MRVAHVSRCSQRSETFVGLQQASTSQGASEHAKGFRLAMVGVVFMAVMVFRPVAFIGSRCS